MAAPSPFPPSGHCPRGLAAAQGWLQRSFPPFLLEVMLAFYIVMAFTIVTALPFILALRITLAFSFATALCYSPHTFV